MRKRDSQVGRVWFYVVTQCVRRHRKRSRFVLGGWEFGIFSIYRPPGSRLMCLEET